MYKLLLGEMMYTVQEKVGDNHVQEQEGLTDVLYHFDHGGC